MRILNKDTWRNKQHTVFVTSYCGLDYFNDWSRRVKNSDDVQIVVIDTGNQEAANAITEVPVFQLSQNVGCAGCWNMAANLGFNYYNLDKIVIGQDDAIFNEYMVELLWKETTDDMLVGAYDRGFTYSLFGLTKNFWNTVGLFDENFVYVTYEDNDYIHRTKLFGKKWKSLNFSADLNANIASRNLGDDVRSINKDYMIEKWGHFEGVYTNPFNNPEIPASACGIHKNLTDVYGNVTKFPSLLEFDELLK